MADARPAGPADDLWSEEGGAGSELRAEAVLVSRVLPAGAEHSGLPGSDGAEADLCAARVLNPCLSPPAEEGPPPAGNRMLTARKAFDARDTPFSDGSCGRPDG